MATQAHSNARLSSERRFYTGMAIAMFATVFVGFSRSFFLRPLFPDWPAPREPIFYVHGAVFAAWSVLLVMQASLVRARRTDVHRRLGWAGAALAVVMTVMGTIASLVAARRPSGFVGIPVPPLQFLAIPIFDMVLFASFVSVAVATRRDVQSHKRWMVLATVNLLGAAVARWPVVIQSGSLWLFFGLTDLFIVALAVWDYRSRGRLHPVTLVGGLLIVISQPLRLVISLTPAWIAFAGWLTGLIG